MMQDERPLFGDDRPLFENVSDKDVLDAIRTARYALPQTAFHLLQTLSSLAPFKGQMIAVDGAWGSGKTSLTNLCTALHREFRASGEKDIRQDILTAIRPRRISAEALRGIVGKIGKTDMHFTLFSPWQDGAEDDLVHQLLSIIQNAATTGSPVAGLSNRIRRMVMRTKIPLGAVAGAAATGDPGSMPGAARLGSTAGERAASETTIENVMKSERNIVVIVDDIDRLPPQRLAMLFSALWWARDLNRVTFLLLFDYEQVIETLGSSLRPGEACPDARRAEAARFLQKIIQFSVTLPVPPPRLLVDEFEKEAWGIFAAHFPEVEFPAKLPNYHGEPRWSVLRKRILHKHLTTPRAVVRLSNAVKIAILTRMFLNLDPHDLIAVEAIRLFDPATWKRMDALGRLVADGGASEDKRYPGWKDDPVLSLLFPATLTGEETGVEVENRRGIDHDSFVDMHLRSHYGDDPVLLYGPLRFFDFEEKRDSWIASLHSAEEEGHLDDLINAVLDDIDGEYAMDRRITFYDQLLVDLDWSGETLSPRADACRKQIAARREAVRDSL